MTDWLRRAARAKSRLGLDPLADDRPDDAFESRWRATVKRRSGILLAFVGVWAAAMLGQLVNLQVLKHERLFADARNQQEDLIKAPAGRGDIVDRRGRLLAYSVDAASIGAAPREVRDDDGVAAALCRALGDCTAADRRDLAARFASDAPWTEVRKARTLTPNQVAAVDALGLRGVYLMAGTRRWYPRRTLAAHLVGYVGADNTGLGGIEHKFDAIIRGREGRMLVQFDVFRQRMATRVEQEATAGATVELTIDLALQHVVERELQEAVRAHQARGGTAIVMDPATGEIYALASYPTFNPNAPGRVPDDYTRNRAVQEVYEPGSTFKIVTASAAIEEGVLRPTDLIDCTPGYLRFPGRVIRDEHRLGLATFEDVIVHSSNVGAVKAGQRVGAVRLERYMRRFGFGERIGPDFAGESRGVVFEAARLDDSALASVSMGYQVSATPLQMAAATSAIANGGLLVEPRIVRATIAGGVRQVVEPTIRRRAILPETAATVTSLLEEVVRRGTARAAALERYQVAGKTGTAKKVVNGRYSETEFNASFVGFVPSRRPALTIVVVIDTPRGGEYYGGKVAAPVFRRIAEAALRELGVPPTINPVPAVVVADASAGRARPVAVTELRPTLARLDGRPLMPDVRGLSGRTAVRILNGAGLTTRVTGDGFVVEQSPQPGEPIEAGGWGALRLARGVEGTTPGGTTPGTTPGVRR